MELEKAPLYAPTACSNERASPIIAAPDLTLYGRGDVSRASPRRNGIAGTQRRGKLRPLQVLEEQRERAIENRGRIAVRSAVPHQILDSPQLIVSVARDRELNLVSLRRERGDDRRPLRWRDNSGEWIVI